MNYLVIAAYQTWECLGKICSEPILDVLVGAGPHVMPQKQIVSAKGWVVLMIKDLGWPLLGDTPFLPVMKSGLLAHLGKVGWVRTGTKTSQLTLALVLPLKGTYWHCPTWEQSVMSINR